MRFFLFEPRRSAKLLLSTFVAILFVLSSFAPTAAVFSETAGSTVDGRFQIESEGPTRLIEFHATRSIDGRVSGEAIFRDDSVVNAEKPSEAVSSDAAQSFFLKADFDCLVINKNKAVMSGSITDSSSRHYVGRRVLVVAQDNGGATDSSKTDRLTWGIYLSDKKWWVASDSERPADEVSQLSWIASDSERADDEGVPSDKEQIVGCQSFPLSSFSFINAKQGHGRVRVRP